MELDGGGPIVIVAGLHVGCYELVGTERIRRSTDLAGWRFLTELKRELKG